MVRNLISSATAAALLAAPIAAQAAPARTSTPVAADEELAGGFLLPALIALAVAVGIYLIVDDGDDEAPVSP